MSELDLGRVVGYGLPAGGAAGQIPVKQSGTDYDTAWEYPQYCRRNLLDNWYFVGGGSQKGNGVFPINQRSQSQYTGGNTIDRWNDTFSTHATVTLPDSGSYLSIVNTSKSSRTIFTQYLTLKSTVLSGKTVTASILLEDNSLISGTSVVPNPSTGSIPAYTTIVGLSGNSIIRLGTNASGICNLEIVTGQEQTLNIVAVKLELGSYQTLAHQENGAWVLNEIPDFGEELRKCQRYYYKLGNTLIAEPGYKGASVNIYVNVPIPVTMASVVRNGTLISGNAPTAIIGSAVTRIGTGGYSTVGTLRNPTVSVYTMENGQIVLQITPAENNDPTHSVYNVAITGLEISCV